MESQSATTSTTSQSGSALENLNTEMTALILPWAKSNHPEKYQQTIATSKAPEVFKRFLIRLIEIRWTTEAEFRSSVPCHVLEETSLVVKFRDKQTQEIIEVKGRNATGGRVWGFNELMLDRQSFDELFALKRDFDLQLVDE